MDIFYIHGFGSRYNPDSDKVRGLSQLGAVRGADYDYTATFDSIIAHLTRETQRADLLVGTSLGGYLAMRLGTLTYRPYIAINPAIDPATSLRAYLGPGTDHYGTDFVMEEATLRSYPPLLPGLAPERGLVLIDEGDEVIDVPATIEMAGLAGLRHFTFPGGDHRFQHMEEALPLIEEHLECIAALTPRETQQ